MRQDWLQPHDPPNDNDRLQVHNNELEGAVLLESWTDVWFLVPALIEV